jgi:phosphocarrier protein HPr
MFERDVIVKGDAGVHARPAMMMVREATRYSCSVSLIKDGVEADCKSIMSVLGLAIVAGSQLTVQADGEGEVEIVNTIVRLIESNFKLAEQQNIAPTINEAL